MPTKVGYTACVPYTFQWDPAKDRANQRKHGVSFAEATTVFGDTLSLTIPDPVHSETEQRFIIVGHSYRHRLLVVVHTAGEESIRIITARRATASERDDYEEKN